MPGMSVPGAVTAGNPLFALILALFMLGYNRVDHRPARVPVARSSHNTPRHGSRPPACGRRFAGHRHAAPARVCRSGSDGRLSGRAVHRAGARRRLQDRWRRHSARQQAASGMTRRPVAPR